MNKDESDRNMYGSDDDSKDSSEDKICFIKDHKIVNNSMKLLHGLRVVGNGLILNM